MPAPGQAIPAMAANDMSFAADKLADFNVVYISAYFRDRSDELMAYNEGSLYCLLSPGVPVENVNVGAADCGFCDLYQDVISTDPRNGYVLHPQALFSFVLDQCFHLITTSYS